MVNALNIKTSRQKTATLFYFKLISISQQGAAKPDSPEVSMRPILDYDQDVNMIENMISVPWDFSLQAPMHHKRPDETSTDNEIYSDHKKRSEVIPLCHFLILWSRLFKEGGVKEQKDPNISDLLSILQKGKKQEGSRASCRVFGGPLCILSRHGEPESLQSLVNRN